MRFARAMSGGLVAWSFLTNLGLGERYYVRRNLIATAGLLLLARRAGLDRRELSLEPEYVGRGVRWGGATAALLSAAVTSGVALADVLPPVASLLDDERARLGTGALAAAVLVRIPLGTALFEEVAFRGVLHAACRRIASPSVATAWSSLVFGLWHIPPTAVALRLNGVEPRSAAGARRIVAAVALTTAAGAGLDLLRARSGSLAAPVLAHWGANASGLAGAALRR